MGQTLTHGVYLPDEGERNCYSGLASNWQLLDGAVGTVAEHTTQIAGKAPLVHTHTKSDVTDLLNSNFIPSATNSYDLGSSSYQWNNLYAKNYYYNGTAWGLDKANVWTGNNRFVDLTVSSVNTIDITQSTLSSAAMSANYAFKDNSGRYWGAIRTQVQTNRSNILKFTVSNWKTDGTQGTTDLCFSYDVNLDKKSFYPTSSNVELGTSTNKWKTLNGINPGALSLPKTDSSITAIGTSGFSFNGTNERIPDTVNIFSNGEALMNGWLGARIAEGAGHYVFLNSDDNPTKSGITAACFSSGIVSTLTYGLSVYIPIKVGDKPAIRWAKPNGGNAQLIFYPCLGNG